MHSRYEPSILGSLRRITRALDVYSRKLARACGLTGPQLVCVRYLAANGTSTPSGLARSVALSQATVTGILDRLEGQGLVQRRRDDVDKRVVRLTLTQDGEALAAWAPSALHGPFSERLAELHDGEQALIDWVLARIVSMMESADGEPATKRSAVTAAEARGSVERLLGEPSQKKKKAKKKKTKRESA